MTGDLVAVAGFVALVVLGLWVAVRTVPSPADDRPPRALHALLSVALLMTALAGATQRELWPFATWKLMAHVTAADVSTVALVCADESGRSFAIDHRAWSPLTEEELSAWIGGPFLRLDASRQDSARRFLLRRAEEARLRARGGENPAARASPLGRFAAASHLLHPARWSTVESTAASPCAALRLVTRSWNVVERAGGDASVRESLIWQYPVAR